MSFGMWFLAVFLPPVYFMVRGRWIAAIINGFFWGLGLLFSLALIGLPLVLLCIAHAGIDVARHTREKEMQRQAQLIAREMQPSEQE